MRKPMSGVCRQSTPGLRGRFERYTSRQALVEFLDADGEDHDRHGEERQDLVPEIGDPQSFQDDPAGDLQEIGEGNELMCCSSWIVPRKRTRLTSTPRRWSPEMFEPA